MDIDLTRPKTGTLISVVLLLLGTLIGGGGGGFGQGKVPESGAWNPRANLGRGARIGLGVGVVMLSSPGSMGVMGRVIVLGETGLVLG